MNLRNRAHFLFWLQMIHHRLDQELSADAKVVWHPFLPSLFSELSLAHTKVVRSPLTNPKVVGSSFTDPEIVRSPFAHTKPIRSSKSKYCSVSLYFYFIFNKISPFSHSKIVRWSFLHVFNIIKLGGKLWQCVRISEKTLTKVYFKEYNANGR